MRLKVLLLETTNRTAVFGRSNSLSQGGMGAYIPSEIPLGAAVVLELTFPCSAKEVRITAAVRSVEGFRYGLEFAHVSEDVRAMIVKSCEGSSLL
jgi:c-di-GMP-binding flagellar brake protein YcgR